MRNRTASLSIVSAYPPPYGGVSVEVQRLIPLLEARGTDFIVYNAVSASQDGMRVFSVYRRRWFWTPAYLMTTRDPVIYLMSERLPTWILGALATQLRGKRVLVQLRSNVLPDSARRSRWFRILARAALKRVTGIVCVSRFLADTVARIGVDPGRIHYRPAFIPPVVDPHDRAAVHPAVWRFLEVHSPIIAANGRVLWYEGKDLYGLDHLVELAARLKPDFPTLGIVVCFWDHKPADDAYLEQLRRRADELKVGDMVLFNTHSGPFIPVLSAANILVRPTTTDGDAVSVREAIYLGIPVVASDAVERPRDARLFQTRNLSDFEAKVRAALGDAAARPEQRRPVTYAEDEERLRQHLDLLDSLSRGDAPGAP